jgi:hypothetical protein
VAGPERRPGRWSLRGDPRRRATRPCDATLLPEWVHPERLRVLQRPIDPLSADENRFVEDA